MMITTYLVRQGSSSAGENWETIYEVEEQGAGIGVLKQKVEYGFNLLVEFKVEGVVWRRCLVGLVDPKTPGVSYTLPESSADMMLEVLHNFYIAETQGGFPLLTLAVMGGNAFIPPLRTLAVGVYENRQARLLNDAPGRLWNSLTFQDPPEPSNPFEQPITDPELEDYVSPLDGEEDISAFDDYLGGAEDGEDD